LANTAQNTEIKTADAPGQKPDSNPIASLVNELIDVNTEIFELKEDIVSKGIPFNTANALVELVRFGKEDELAQLKRSALQTARSQYGAGALKADVLDDHLVKLTDLEEDLSHLRRVAKGRNLEPQAVNLLTNVIRQNPGDRGCQVLSRIFEYARACDIPIKTLVPVDTGVDDEPESVLPDIKLPEPDTRGWKRFKDLGVDLLIGAVMAICALALLT